MRTLGLLLVALTAAVPLAAQPPHPDCARLPGGGRLTVTVPGATTPPLCQLCSGPEIPANPVFAFSDGSRGTCELKAPDGRNTGVCKKDTTCPAGTTRAAQNGVWACQAPSTTKVVECPAAPQPRAPEPPACLKQLETWSSRLKQRQQELDAAFSQDLAARGPAAATALKSFGVATVAYGLATATFMNDLSPIGLRQLVVCSDQSTAQATADCEKTKRDYYETQDRKLLPIMNRMNSELAAADTALEALHQGAGDPGGKAIAAAEQDLAEAKRQIEACEAEMRRRFGGGR